MTRHGRPLSFSRLITHEVCSAAASLERPTTRLPNGNLRTKAPARRIDRTPSGIVCARAGGYNGG